MTDEKGPVVSLPIKEFVDREIKNLKDQVYIELDSRAKALDLAHGNSLRALDLAHHNSLWTAGIIVTIANLVLGIVIAIMAHFWK